MSHWKRLSGKGRAAFLTLAVLVLTTAAWAAGRTVAVWEEVSSTGADEPADLKAPLPPPSDVFIQKTSAFGSRGNVLVMVKLTPEQLARKQAEGTRSFVAIGDFTRQVILRDDGQQGDAAANDGVFTGLGFVDDATLQARATADQQALQSGATSAPRFTGRTLSGQESQVPFDYAGFQAGQVVRFHPAVVRVSSPSATLASSKGMVKAVNATNPPSPFAERVLMIRHPGVVADPTRTIDPCTLAGNPNGVWTFKHLMTQMANPAASGIDPSLFAEDWLKNWVNNQTINSFPVPSRPQMQAIIDQWRAESGGGKLDLGRAPLRLLAIVSRVDLRRTTGGSGGYGGSVSGDFLDAGEARFIFGFVLRPGWRLNGGYSSIDAPRINTNGCQALPFSVIFEYRVPKCGCEGVKAWAQSWVDLNAFVPGTFDYNSRLERLTQTFVRANANPTQPNGSAIGQVRTNEIALQAPWQLREFQLPQSPFSLLAETTTADTADDVFNNSPVFRDWILTQISPAIAGPTWDQPVPAVPLFFQAGNFLGARPEAPGPGFFWNAPGLAGGVPSDNWGRHRASLNTCNGCHAGETNTIFVHVDPSTPGLPAALSGFLTGNNVNDPAFGAPNRAFNDLARREADILRVAGMTCFQFQPVNVATVQSSLRSTGRLPADLFAGSAVVPPERRVRLGVDDMKRNVIQQVH